jgi:hypothetical protein
MFNERTASFFKNESLFDVKSTTSQIFGQCYTVCCLISVPPKCNKFLYGLRSNFDIKVFIHQKWADFWLTGFGDFPIDISSVIIESNISNGMVAAVLTFSEVENTFLSKVKSKCKTNTEDTSKELNDYIECSKDQLWNHLPPDISCIIIDFKNIVPRNAFMSECTNDTIADSIYWSFGKFLSQFAKQSWNYGCPIPCKQTSYKLNLNYFHENTVRLQSNHDSADTFFTLWTYYSTLDIEESIENLEYDLATFLVAAGGNLGLFLGFSCMSLLFDITNFVNRFLHVKFQH